MQFILINRNKFCEESDKNEVWGDLKDNYAYILPIRFTSILEEAGYNPTAVMSYLKQEKLIECQSGRNTYKWRISKVSQNCIKLQMFDFWEGLTDGNEGELPY